VLGEPSAFVGEFYKGAGVFEVGIFEEDFSENTFWCKMNNINLAVAIAPCELVQTILT
jgi:hypothetical protein